MHVYVNYYLWLCVRNHGLIRGKIIRKESTYYEIEDAVRRKNILTEEKI